MPSHRWDWHWRVMNAPHRHTLNIMIFFKVFKSFFIFAEACFFKHSRNFGFCNVSEGLNALFPQNSDWIFLFSRLWASVTNFSPQCQQCKHFFCPAYSFPPPTQLSETVARKDEIQTVWEKTTFIDRYLKFNTRSYSDADDFLFEKSCDVFINHFTRIVCE